MGTNRNDLRKRATSELLSYGFFRFESALTISLTILLAFLLPRPFAFWRWWYWIVMGALFEALIIYTTVTDERTGRMVAAALLREAYDPRDIKTPELRERFQQVLEYRDRIEQTIAETPVGLLRDHLSSTDAIASWIGHIYDLLRRLDTYQRDELLHRDMKQLPASITRLQRALAAETDPLVADQMRATLAAKDSQRVNLEALESSMERAEYQLEETISSLGTVYSQFQLVQARKAKGTKARALSDSIDNQVQQLQDILDTMDQVYGPTA